jgi:hypothetical protein
VIDSKKAAEILEEIADDDGRLTPDAVIKAATSPRHPLHDYFEWDDKKAGAAYRLDQARDLIAFVRIEVTERNLSARIAYVRDPSATNGEQGYRATAHLADEKQQAAVAVITELERVLSYLHRAADVADAVNVRLDVQDLLARTENLIASLRKLRLAS